MIVVSMERKQKMLISCAVTAQLIYAFVFAYACCWFSYSAANMNKNNYPKKYALNFIITPHGSVHLKYKKKISTVYFNKKDGLFRPE